MIQPILISVISCNTDVFLGEETANLALAVEADIVNEQFFGKPAISLVKC